MDNALDAAYYLAEWYLPELTEQSVDDIVAKLDVAANAVGDVDKPVTLLVTLAVPTDEVLYGVFDARSSEVVTLTCDRAGVPHQRLSPHVDTRIRRDSIATMAGIACVSADAEPEPLAQ